MKYPSYKGRQWVNEEKLKDYTLVVCDMIDGVNGVNTNHGFDAPKDEVSGYTIRQIEDVLSYTSSWEDWKNNIKNKYNNATEHNLDKLFKAYE